MAKRKAKKSLNDDKVNFSINFLFLFDFNYINCYNYFVIGINVQNNKAHYS